VTGDEKERQPLTKAAVANGYPTASYAAGDPQPYDLRWVIGRRGYSIATSGEDELLRASDELKGAR